MFVVREIQHSDLESVYELASFLNSFNLPYDRDALTKQIEQSRKSFSSSNLPKQDAVYMFALEDIKAKRIIGTSLVFGKHGTESTPHTYLKVLKKTHSDRSTQVEQTHTLLRFEYDTDGPTEIGGLILHPDYRNSPYGHGRLLSYSRFLYMGLHLDRFEDTTIAELLPPFNAEGSSDLWEAFGRRFTGMHYADADRLSRSNRDFIRNLFPQEDIYTCLFSDSAKAVIGQTGPTSTPVKRMLERVGFSYLDAVDPFDGGPHFGVKTKEITLIKRMKKLNLSNEELKSAGQTMLIAFENSNGFHCLSVPAKVSNLEIQISPEVGNYINNQQANSAWIVSIQS